MDNSRTLILIGKDNLDKLKSKHVTIVGTGGVGGYIAIMLARAGIEKFTLIDFDDVSPSNVNRQIVAFSSTIGRKKVEVLKEMIEDINPKAEILIYPQRLTCENIKNLIGQTDIVIDAIDSVKDKVELIAFCKLNSVKIISAMGAGNRYDIPSFELKDIFSTSDDGLAKAVRKGLRERKIDSLEVVISQSKAKKVEGGVIGSISYYPAMSGCYIAAVVVNKIVDGQI